MRLLSLASSVVSVAPVGSALEMSFDDLGNREKHFESCLATNSVVVRTLKLGPECQEW